MTVAQTLQYGSSIRPCQGERVSGDAVIIRQLDDGLLCAIVDVLGHGAEAHELTHVIDAYLARFSSADVAGVLKRLHLHLTGTRGAAVGLCAIDAGAGQLSYAGIGNTSMRRFGADETRMVSRDGVLGQNMRSPHTQTLQLAAGDLVVLYTDGVSDRFSSGDYPGLALHAPREVANNIVERFGKSHDDAACIAVRYQP